MGTVPYWPTVSTGGSPPSAMYPSFSYSVLSLLRARLNNGSKSFFWSLMVIIRGLYGAEYGCWYVAKTFRWASRALTVVNREIVCRKIRAVE